MDESADTDEVAFDVVDGDAVHDGTATDAYFLRTEEALEHAGRNPTVVAEVTRSQFPNGEYGVFAGIEDVARLFAGRDVDVDALTEGRLFDGGPVLRVEGPYLAFARLETSLLGFLSEASAYATRALEARLAAPESTVLSFGSRHRHPAVAAVIERAAVVGGLDGFSHVAAGEVIGREAGGTMPHALLLCFGPDEQEAAWRAFDEGVGPEVPRVALCDTFDDEADEAVRAAETIENLDAVRLDTTASRRGDLEHIVREVRWELDAAGHEAVDVFVSGGVGPGTMETLRPYVEGFGVGSFVTNGPPTDFGLDIVEVDGDPVAKRGRLSGAKAVYRTDEGVDRVVARDAATGEDGEPLLEPLVRDGRVVREFDLDAATDRARADADLVGFGVGPE